MEIYLPEYDTLSPLLPHVHILSVSLCCAEDLGMVEQLLQTISRELSVVDVMGVFRGTHDTTSLVLSSYIPVSKPPHSPHPTRSQHLPILHPSLTAPLPLPPTPHHTQAPLSLCSSSSRLSSTASVSTVSMEQNQPQNARRQAWKHS